uniref:HAT C-terminal dimerisation domain-containing protein n=1 Tax=Ditylenchus dipsaci TaxID=166011 RepID=A0A915E5D2_9BILA
MHLISTACMAYQRRNIRSPDCIKDSGDVLNTDYMDYFFEESEFEKNKDSATGNILTHQTSSLKLAQKCAKKTSADTIEPPLKKMQSKIKRGGALSAPGETRWLATLTMVTAFIKSLGDIQTETARLAPDLVNKLEEIVLKRNDLSIYADFLKLFEGPIKDLQAKLRVRSLAQKYISAQPTEKGPRESDFPIEIEDSLEHEIATFALLPLVNMDPLEFWSLHERTIHSRTSCQGSFFNDSFKRS